MGLRKKGKLARRQANGRLRRRGAIGLLRRFGIKRGG